MTTKRPLVNYSGAIQELVATDALPLRVTSVTPSAGAATLDWGSYDLHRVTLNAATVTLTFSNPSDGQRCAVELIQDATGGRAVVWPGTVAYDSGIPAVVVNGAANARTTLVFLYHSGAYSLVGMSTNGVLWPAQSSTIDPTTSDIPAGSCAVWVRSDTGTAKLYANVSGTLKSVALS